MTDYPTRIMVVGNGGRECAIATALLESPRVERLFITPANWGVLDLIGGRVTALHIGALDSAGIIAAAQEHSVQLVVIGPEAPLVAGLADELRAAGLATVGPGHAAALLEGSKNFAKEFMRRHAIPTAKYSSFTDYVEARDWISRNGGPLVLKADGLAAGKGVIVCDSQEEALEAVSRIMEAREFGAAGERVLVEERLSGQEISFSCLVAGGRAEVLPPSSDYKRLGDNDEGPNTGGMGNICPTPWATDEVIEEFCTKILAPFMRGLKADGIDYRGFLFVGTMLTEAGLKVIEFNVRFGDPEAECVLPLCEADWPALLQAIADGELPTSALRLRDGACVTVVLASANYPFGSSEPAQIEGFERVAAQGLLVERDADGQARPGPVRINFSGVLRELPAEAGAEAGQTYTSYFEDSRASYLASGGRILAVSAIAEDLSRARRLAYEVLGNLRFEGMRFRSDIAKLR